MTEFATRLRQASQHLQLRQLSQNEPELFESYGRLTRVNGMVLTACGGQFALGQGYQVENKAGQWFDAEVVGFDQEQAFLMPLEAMGEIYSGARVRSCQLSPPFTQIDDALLGRVVDGLLRPLDNQGPIPTAEPTEQRTQNQTRATLGPMDRRTVDTPLDVGIRAINGLFTLGQGQRLGLFAGSGVGKSKLLGMMTRFTSADVVVVGLVGERGWEVKEFVEQSLGKEGLNKSVVVAAPADDSPLLRVRAARLCHQLAAHYRDQGHNVLLLMDSLTRFAQAHREIGLSVGEPPATKGYPPSVFSQLTALVESAGNTVHSSGSMSVIYTVLAEGDDPNDPIVDSARAILDGHIVLDRSLAEQGHYPAIDIGASISRVMPNIVDKSQLQACYKLKRLYGRYRQVQELIPLGAYQQGKDTELDQAVRLYPEIERFLCQGLDEQADLQQSIASLEALLNLC